ncbi:MAG: response regulator [Desulfobacteraceae bacterium]|nr:response regulator [Desulfobacteraceae bacterium]
MLDPDIEQMFNASDLAYKTSALKKGILVYILLNVLGQLIVIEEFNALTSCMILPSLLLYAGLGLPDKDKWIDLFSCFFLIIFSVGFACMEVASSFSNLVFYIFCLMIFLGLVLLRIRFSHAAITVFCLVVAYSSVLFIGKDSSFDLLQNRLFFLGAVSISGLFACYGIETYRRLIFVNQTAMDQMQKEIEDALIKNDEELIRMNKSLTLEIQAHSEAEAQLKESEEKYKNLVNSLPDGIFIIQNYRIVYVNPSMLTITGYEQHKLLGADQFLLLEKEFDENKALPGDLFLRSYTRKNGQIVHIEQSYVKILYNFAPAHLFVMRDITEKVKTLKEKASLEKELVKAKKMEALGLLAGGVAHDLNNILSGIVSTPEFLLMDLPVESDLVEPLEIIKDSGKRAAEIVDELLTMARGSVQVVEPVHLNQVVQDYLISPEFYKLSEFHPHVMVKTCLKEDLSYIHASGTHLRKVIMNLVSNAAEALDDKGDVIIHTDEVFLDQHTIEGYEKVLDGEYVLLRVEDTGQGISDQDLERIFEPFYTKKVLGRSGTGLGLSIVWNTVHDHNGYINVINGKETTSFNLYFPIAQDAVPITRNQIVTFEDYKGCNERILIVDDINIQRKVAYNMLIRLGYKADVVSSGEEALAYIKDNKVDLVILDMIMEPGMSGLETFIKLREIDPDISAVISSGYSKTNDVQKAQKLGAGDFIKKPYSLESIGVAVKKELNNKRL